MYLYVCIYILCNKKKIYIIYIYLTESRKKKSKFDKTKYSEVFRRKCNFENDEIHLNSIQSQSMCLYLTIP